MKSVGNMPVMQVRCLQSCFVTHAITKDVTEFENHNGHYWVDLDWQYCLLIFFQNDFENMNGAVDTGWPRTLENRENRENDEKKFLAWKNQGI